MPTERRYADHLDVAFAEETTTVPSEDMAAGLWTSWATVQQGEAAYHAVGPCPACRAEAEGAVLDVTPPEHAQGGQSVSKDTHPVVQISVHCSCGHSHGAEGKTGCGRSWTIEVDGVA